MSTNTIHILSPISWLSKLWAAYTPEYDEHFNSPTTKFPLPHSRCTAIFVKCSTLHASKCTKLMIKIQPLNLDRSIFDSNPEINNPINESTFYPCFVFLFPFVLNIHQVMPNWFPPMVFQVQGFFRHTDTYWSNLHL